MAAKSAADITKQHNVAFTAKGLNPYGQGPAFEINRPPINVSSKPLNFSSKPIIDIPIGPGSLAEFIPGIDLPSFLRLQAGIGVFGSNNLEFGYYATAGRLDINYPATSDLRFSTTPGEENVQTNRTYTIDGGFLPGVTQQTIPSEFWTTLGPGGPDLWLSERVKGDGGFEVRVGPPPPTISAPYFAVSNPYAQAWLDSYIDVRAGAYAKVTALGGLFEVGKSFTIGGRIDGPRLAEVDPSGFYISGQKVSDASITDPIPFTILNVGTATLQVPSLALAGKNLNGTTLAGSSVKPVLTLDADLEKMIPGIGNFLKGSVGPFSYTLVNVHGGPQIGLKHDISFAPDPKVRLQFSEPVLVRGRACGDAVCADPADQELRPTLIAEMDLESDTLVWQPMFSNSTKIRVTPTYIMDNQYINKIGIDWSVQGGIRALELTEPIDIEPLIDESITASIAETELFSTPPIRLDLPNVVGSFVDIPKFNVPILGADLVLQR